MIRKLRFISKFMTSKPGKQTIAINIMPNISRNKDNQAKKFGQFYNITRGTFFLKNHTNCGRKIILRRFSRK